MALTRVLLLRHAESADPTVFHGAESDVGLSERGRRQAAAVAPALAAFNPTVVISSGMRRALDTSAPIAAACGLAIQVEADLHERRVGSLSGTSFQDGDSVWPATLQRWLAGETGYAPDGAESFDAIRARVLPVWNRVTQCFTRQTLVIVCHGVVCKVLLLCLLDGWGPSNWHRLGPIRNVAIHELVREATTWQAIRINDLPEPISRI
jgi:broad specificity phosphatase PhoE